MLLIPARAPEYELRIPVEFTAPELAPTKRLLEPVTLNTRSKPMLYCVAEVTEFPDSDPLTLAEPGI